MKPLTIAIAQMHPALGDLDANQAAIEAFIAQASEQGAQLLCLPEACLTGYRTARSRGLAIAAGNQHAQAIEKYAREHGLTLSYGFIEENEDPAAAPYVTHVVCGAQSGRVVYRKSHLGFVERNAFCAGSELVAGTVDGVCVGVQLCWESHIPDISSALRARGAELLLVPFASGSHGERRRETWACYLPARASDNGCFVAAVNALSDGDEGQTLGGGICVLDPHGRELASYFGSDEHLLVCELDGVLPREQPQDTMRTISYFDRRRPELYG